MFRLLAAFLKCIRALCIFYIRPLDFAIDSIMKTSLIAATLATVDAAQYVKGKCGGDSKWHYDIWAPESKGSRSHGARREECCQSS